MDTNEGSRREFLEVLADYDVPAYIRRAQGVEQAWAEFKNRCERKRQDLRSLTATRLAMLAALVDSNWPLLRGYLSAAGSVEYLAELHQRWQPELRVQVEPSNAPRKITGAIEQLAASMERFNRNWKTYLDQLDLSDVNKIRQGYNDYYVVEKACAFESERLGQIGFKPLGMLKIEEVLAEFPYLDPPKLR